MAGPAQLPGGQESEASALVADSLAERAGCRLDAGREEVLGMTVYMGGGPALMYAADALGAFEQFSAAQPA